MAVYLYGVGRHSMSPPSDVDPVSPARAFDVVIDDDLGALVSEVPASRPPATSRNLLAHERVVDAVASDGGFIPARFGVVAEDASALVAELLRPRHAALARTLEVLSGRVELRLTLAHDGDELLREALERSPRLAKLRRRVRGRPEAATYYDRIALGEVARDEVLQLQQRDLEDLGARLERLVAGQKVLAAPDGSAVRMAYLVGSEDLGRFDEVLEEYAADNEDRLRLELLGPLAPWDFAGLADDRADLVTSTSGGNRRLANKGG